MKEKADLVIFNAKIYSVDTDFAVYDAMAVRDGKILDIGDREEILSAYRSDQMIDLENKYVYPGFIDPHCHFLGYGLYKQKLDLKGTSSLEEILEKLVVFDETNKGEWIIGRGWDQNDWPTKEFPVNDRLNELFPDRPVMLVRIDGHAVLVNDKALEMAGIDANTVIPGGEVILLNGRPSGVLIDEAADKVKELAGQYSDEELEQALLQAQEDCFSVGLTTVSDAGLDHNEVDIIQSLIADRKLDMRMYVMLNPTDENMQFIREKGVVATDNLSIRAIKLYADGALGSRGAALLQPYSDDSLNHGLLLHEKEYFEMYCKIAVGSEYQICAHAIGDSASHFLTELYADFLEPGNDRRWRIEHAQTVHPMDYEKMKIYRIIPSVQTTHATSDMYWAEKRLGPERINYAYAYNDLLKLNGWIPNGSDFPIESINPLYGFYAAVARKDQEGYPEEGFQTENALDREEALRAMTIWAARSNFEEAQKGSLEKGKYADFVVLENDLMEAEETQLFSIKVLKTFLGGTVVFDRNATQ